MERTLAAAARDSDSKSGIVTNASSSKAKAWGYGGALANERTFEIGPDVNGVVDHRNASSGGHLVDNEREVGH
jgi:hypothetical protein